jgi:tetratricopeptide (TPR) repeat protein
MTKKRSHPSPPPSRRADAAFKLGLTALFVAALAVTFWSRSTPPRPGDHAAPGATPSPVSAAPPVPAPTAPAIAGVTDSTPLLPDADPTHERADALLIERMLASDTVADLSMFGQDLMSRGDSTNAVRIFRRAVELDTGSELNHYNLGLALARLKQTNEAIAEYRAALEIYPDFAEAHNSLGLQLAALGDLTAAEKHYRAALEVQPDFPTALNNLGTIMARKREYDYALTWFQKAVALETNYVDARFNLANALLALGKTNEAMGRLQDIVNEFPDHRPSQMVLIRLMSAEARKP